MKTPHYTPKTSTVYTAPAPGFLIYWDNGASDTDYRDAAGNEFRGPSDLDRCVPFASRELAQSEIDNGGHTLCGITEAPAMDIFVYRADSYRSNMGDLRGFFLTKEDAMYALRVEDSEEVDFAEGDFEQITLFGVAPHDLDGVDLGDNEAMMAESIWGNGNIIDTFYFN